MLRRRPWWRVLLEEFRAIEEEMQRFEEEFMRRIKEAEAMRGCIIPLYNIYESGDEVILTADMPGVNKEEIDLRVGEDYVRVEAPCRSALRPGQKYLLHIKLPSKIDPSTVRARYREGVLEIVAKKKVAGVRVKVE